MIQRTLACLLLLVACVAPTGAQLNTASRGASIPTDNTPIPAACEIVWRNAPSIFCMDDDGTDLTQLTTYAGFAQFDHMAVSPQKGHIAASYLDSAGYNHIVIFDLANDTMTPLVPYFQNAGYGG